MRRWNKTQTNRQITQKIAITNIGMEDEAKRKAKCGQPAMEENKLEAV